GAGPAPAGLRAAPADGRRSAARPVTRALARAAVLGLALALLATGCSSDGGASQASTTSTSVDLDARVKTYVVPSRNHVAGPVDYPQKPPVGGDHAPVWQNCGLYSQPVPTERAVHSMEHGAVWITYRPGLPKSQVDVLRALARSTPYVLVAPWADG